MITYLIATDPDGDLLKIGRTTDVAQRLREIIGQSGGQGAQLVATIDGDHEGRLHRAFRDLRAEGPARARGLPHAAEWFRLEGGLLELVLALRRGESVDQALPRPVVRPQPEAPLSPADRRLERARRLWLATRRARRQLAYRHVADFVQQAWHVLHPADRLVWGPHLDAICAHLEWLAEGWLAACAGRAPPPGWVQDFLFNAAPSSLKSELIGVFFPAWIWLRRPDAKWGCYSAVEKNVKRDSNACRKLVESEWYRGTFEPTWSIDPTVSAVGTWSFVAPDGAPLGGRVSAPFGAGKTGQHFSWIHVGDPDVADHVHGDAAREESKERWRALSSRDQVGGYTMRLVDQQRLHVDDLSALLLSQGWACLSIPADYDPARARETPMITAGGARWRDWRTTPGEPYHVFHDAARRARAILDLGPDGYQAQHGQAPDNLEGGMVRRAAWRWWRPESPPGQAAPDALPRPAGCALPAASPTRVLPIKKISRDRWVPRFDRVAVTMDCSGGSLAPTASRWGTLVVGAIGKDRFVWDDRSRRRDMVDAIAMCRELEALYGPTLVLVEAEAGGPHLIAALRDAGVGGVVGVDARGDKKSRFHAVTPQIAAGDVYLLEGAPWLSGSCGDADDPGFVPEVSGFPGMKHDDRADALAHLLAHWRGETSLEDYEAATRALGRLVL